MPYLIKTFFLPSPVWIDQTDNATNLEKIWAFTEINTRKLVVIVKEAVNHADDNIDSLLQLFGRNMKSRVVITSVLLITISLTTGACGLVRNSRQSQMEEANFRTECANRKSAYLNAQRRQADSIAEGQGFVEVFACTNEQTKQLTVAFEGQINQQHYFDPSRPPQKSSIGSRGSTMLAGTYTVKFLTQGKVWQKGSLEVKPKSHIRFVVDANGQTVQVDNSIVWNPNLAIASEEAYDLSEAKRLEPQQ